MILCEEKGFDFLELIAKKLSDKDIELVLLDDEEMRELNKIQRNIDKSTDVLSFPLKNINENLPLGSVVINLTLAKEKARELKHTLKDEISLLFIHATLHLLGFDHEIDNGEMHKKEKELIEYFKLPKSLITRTEKE